MEGAFETPCVSHRPGWRGAAPSPSYGPARGGADSRNRGGRFPFFSPDGEWVVFFTADSLKKVLLAGGPPVTLTPTGPRIGASWSEDGTILFASLAAPGIMRVSEAGGEAQPVITGDDIGTLRWMNSLPDGKGVLFTVYSDSLDTARIAVQSTDMPEPMVLADGTDPKYLPTGHILFARENALWAMPFDLERLTVTGEATPVVEDVQVNSGGLALYAVADDGSLAYLPDTGGSGGTRRLAWINRNGAEEPVASPPRSYRSLSLSPDGTRAAVEILDGGRDIWVAELSRGTLTRITSDPGDDTNPLWSPDGQRLLFGSARNGPPELLRKSADGSGEVEVLTSFDGGLVDLRASSWTPDGTTVAMAVVNPGIQADIGTVSVDGTGDWEPLIQTPASEHRPVISPSGHWLAYASDETGQYEVYLDRFPDLGFRQLVSNDGGTQPTWSPDGSELFYLSGSLLTPVAMMRVGISAESADIARLGTPELLFEFQYYVGPRAGRSYDVSPDGERFVMMSNPATGSQNSPGEIHVVLNWLQELTERVPLP